MSEGRKTTRSRVLDAARDSINGPRDRAYGSPEENFARIARYWNEHLSNVMVTRLANCKDRAFVDGVLDYLVDHIRPADVAVMMSLLKISRIAESPSTGDHWVDLAGYAACGAEVVGADIEGGDD